MTAIDIKFNTTKEVLPVTLKRSVVTLPVTLKESIVTTVGADPYVGNYEVTPSRKNQILKTTGKIMTNNVTVFGIPYSSTSNLAGGQTFYIAKMVETPEENDDISRYALGTGLLGSIVLQGESFDDTSRYALGNGILNQIILK